MKLAGTSLSFLMSNPNKCLLMELSNGRGCKVIDCEKDTYRATELVYLDSLLSPLSLTSFLGATYMDIHKMGGGIGFTVKHTRAASEAELEALLLYSLPFSPVIVLFYAFICLCFLFLSLTTLLYSLFRGELVEMAMDNRLQISYLGFRSYILKTLTSLLASPLALYEL